MEKEFWLDKWHRMEIGFHLDEVNATLVQRWPDLGVDQGSVLVPLCGKSLDVIWFLQQGCRVVAAELSEKALSELVELIETGLGWSLQRSESNGQILWHHEQVLLVCGDFFELTSEQVGAVDAVYDRAALVALPPEMRAEYMAQVQRLAPDAVQLLLSFDYDQAVMSGPPFSVEDAEIRAGYASQYEVSLLERRELIEYEDRFRSRGLQSFVQCTYRLTPRAG